MKFEKQKGYSIPVGDNARYYKITDNDRAFFGVVHDRPIPSGTTSVSFKEFVIGTQGKQAWNEAKGCPQKVNEGSKFEMIIKGDERFIDNLPNPSTPEYKKIIKESKQFIL